MPKSKPLPTQQELHELFDYSVVTGQLYWKKPFSSRIKAGDVAGTFDRYTFIRIRHQRHAAHRLIWVWVTGEDPGAMDIDHINGDKTCNAWHNLRLATKSQNMRNTKVCKGYYFNKNRVTPWHARITTDQGVIHLGYFRTESEAAAAYKEASLKYHGEFSRYTVSR